MSDYKDITWVNGCFDVLHRGHFELFKHASTLGGAVVVGIDSDRRISSAKGKTRPINVAKDRRFALESIKYIDKVEIFDTDIELAKLISSYCPIHLVVGEDWKDKTVIGCEFARNTHFFKKINSYSTTNIIKALGTKKKENNL